MSFDGHVLCQRMLITPWALATFGAATADAVAVAAATLRKLRRVGRADFDDLDMALLPLHSRAALALVRIYPQTAYSPLSSNSIAATWNTVTITYLPAPVTQLRCDAPLGRTVVQPKRQHNIILFYFSDLTGQPPTRMTGSARPCDP
jgi:hypothetical protein